MELRDVWSTSLDISFLDDYEMVQMAYKKHERGFKFVSLFPPTSQRLTHTSTGVVYHSVSNSLVAYGVLIYKDWVDQLITEPSDSQTNLHSRASY